MNPMGVIETTNREKLRLSWQRWWEGALDRPLVMCESYQPVWSQNHAAHRSKPSWYFAGQYALEIPVDDVMADVSDQLNHAVYYGDAFPKFWVNFGPGLVAVFLGSAYEFQSDTIWLSPAKSANGVSWEQIPLNEISLEFDPQHPLWQRVYALTQAAVQLLGGQASIGITDLGGNLDILASLIGSTRLAMEMLDNPDEVERLCNEIRQVWLHCYEQLHTLIDAKATGSSCWAAVWSPERYYMFQSDFAYMISPNLFKRFVIPDLTKCAQTIPNAFYHLDGKGQLCHLEQLLALESLRGIQWIPGDGAPPPEEWLDLLKRILDGGKLCQLYVSADGARQIVQALGGKGLALSIDDDLTQPEAEALIRELTGE